MSFTEAGFRTAIKEKRKNPKKRAREKTPALYVRVYHRGDVRKGPLDSEDNKTAQSNV